MYLIDIRDRCKLTFGGSTGGALRINYNGGYIFLAKPARHPSTTPRIAEVLQYPIHTISSLC
ncbi:hypothetical protein GYMLUDRAFT_48848 [Collybiopsis luxurians FD-317 M1]|uniref:Uncharacterized protein n=1 Tax=Collybiopsis luxurians FD-317 M1 TaxID=944289 RepID=A0A0D0BHM3_9AGAR|nr:hypothetical protein GYMLUDRAFT_48848 [Collybiopsis luxurians FD-317 M1]